MQHINQNDTVICVCRREGAQLSQTRRMFLSNWIGMAERLSKVTKVPQDEVLNLILPHAHTVGTHKLSWESEVGRSWWLLYLILSNKLCSAVLSGRVKRRRTFSLFIWYAIDGGAIHILHAVTFAFPLLTFCLLRYSRFNFLICHSAASRLGCYPATSAAAAELMGDDDDDTFPAEFKLFILFRF